MKIITTNMLVSLNNAAIKADRNRTLKPEWLTANADPEGIHVIDQVLLHNEVEWRTTVLIKVNDTLEPVQGFLDVSFTDWDRVEAFDIALHKALDDANSDVDANADA